MSVDPQAFKQTMAHWASGVTVITTITDGTPYGMTANSFTSLSLNPLLITLNIGKTVHSHDLIQESGIFAVNILNAQQAEWGKRFAGLYPQVENRFEGIDYSTAVTGAPLLPDVLGWMDCRLYATYDGGDHTILVGEVQATSVSTNVAPLTYYNRTWGTFTPVPAPHSLTHVVLMKLQESTAENIDFICSALNSLHGKVPEIRSLSVGANVVPSERAYDLALTVVFDSLADMQAYQAHPEHVKVLDQIRPLFASVVAVDYEN